MNEPARRSLHSATRAALIGLVAVFAIAAAFTRQPAISTGEDDAEYVLLSRAILDFHYRDVADVARGPHTRYPPGYPAALAAVSAVVGERLTAFTVLGIIWSVATVVLTFAIARRHLSDAWALIVSALVAMNPWFLSGAGRLISEPQFTALTALALWAGLRDPRTAATDVLAGAAAVAAAMTRLVGVTLIAALLIDWLVRRRLRSAVALAAAAGVTIGSWLVYAASAPEQFLGDSYIADARSIVAPENAPHEAARRSGTSESAVGRFAQRSTAHARWYITQALPYRLAVPTVARTVVDNIAWVAALAALITLGAASIWRQSSLLVVFLALYGGLLVFWRWGIDRFLDPVIPLVLGLVAAGCALLGRLSRPGLGYVAFGVVAVLLGFQNLRADAAALGRAAECDRANATRSEACFPRAVDRAFFAAADYAATDTPPTAVFVTPKEHTFYFYSGRTMFPIRRALALPEHTMLDTLRSDGVEFLVLAQLGPVQVPYLARLRQICERLQEVRRFEPNVVIFRILEAGQSGGTDGCAALRDYRARF